MEKKPASILIVGGGLAGVFCALKLAPLPVKILAPAGIGGASAWAQGGVAAAVSEGDTPEVHAADTVAAGAGLVDADIALGVALEARARIDDLLAYGAPFDRDALGVLQPSREAAHTHRRIVRVRGDAAGRAIMETLAQRVRETPSIEVIEGLTAYEIYTLDGRAAGVLSLDADGRSRFHPCKALVLATGGVGHLYRVTTNPVDACGAGVAMAARAGALISDAEFVQFHPTAIDIGADPAPLATESLRGEGALIVDRDGHRFLADIDPAAELAARDIVARGVFNSIAAGKGAFLDARVAVGKEFATRFPTVYASCMAAGIDPATAAIPIAPAAHYHMGGVATDAKGRTSLPGLWAAGEVACTGLHGANRLASNSLLEALVFGARVAADVGADLAATTPLDDSAISFSFNRTKAQSDHNGFEPAIVRGITRRDGRSCRRRARRRGPLARAGRDPAAAPRRTRAAYAKHADDGAADHRRGLRPARKPRRAIPLGLSKRVSATGATLAAHAV